MNRYQHEDAMSKKESSNAETTSPISFSVLPGVLSYRTNEFSADGTAIADQVSEGHKRDQNRLLSVHEVAQLLQVPVSWVYGRMRRRSTEQLPAYRIGKYWRFREEEIMAWVQAQRRGSDAA
jgi:excisionase family DNA binding protein